MEIRTKSFNQFILEIFDYSGNLKRNKWRENDLKLGDPEKEDVESYDLDINGKNYNFERYKKHGAYEINFTHDGSYKTPDEYTPHFSKILGITKKLAKEKIDAGFPVKLSGIKPKLHQFYSRLLNKLNQREYDGKLYQKDGFDVGQRLDYSLISKKMPAEKASDIETEHDVHNVLAHNPDNNELHHILDNHGHLMNDHILAKIAGMGNGEVQQKILDKHYDKIGDNTFVKIKDESAMKHPNYLKYSDKFWGR